MRQSKRFGFPGTDVNAAVALLGIYLVFALVRKHTDQWNLLIGAFTSVLEIGLDIILVATCIRNFPRLEYSMKVLTFSFIFLLIGDLTYNLQVNILNLTNLRGSPLELTYNIPYLLFLLMVGATFVLLTVRYVKKHRFIILSLALACGIGFLGVFLPRLIDESLPWWSFINRVISIFSQGVFIGLTIVYLIFSRSIPLRLMAAGFLMIFSYNTLLEFIEIFGMLTQGLATEAFWILGQIIVLLGIRIYLINGGLFQRDSAWSQDICDFRSLDSKLVIYGLILSISVLGSWHGVVEYWRDSSRLPPISVVLGWGLMMIVILAVFTVYVRSLAIQPLNQLQLDLTSAFESSDFNAAKIGKSRITEFRQLCEGIITTFDKLRAEKEKNEILTKMATQMSHDIRSPLAALRMLTSQVDQLPEETRQMMQSIAARIHLIADTLVKAQLQSQKESRVEAQRRCIASSVVESIVSEKRLLVPKKVALEFIVLDQVYGTWVGVHEEALGRALSNLLNNSIEAFEENKNITNCRITVTLSASGDSALRLTVQDNAGGVSEIIENQIREGMKTSSKEHGLGLGLAHAKELLNECNGRFELLTQYGFGTVINLIIPKLSSPHWFADSIDVRRFANVVVVDDDPSIHQVWMARFQGHRNVIHYNSIKSLIENLPRIPVDSVFLLDQEFRGSQTTGVGLIESHLRGSQVVLVTSHYLDDSVVGVAQRSSVRVLPKFLAPFVEILA